MHSSIYWKAVYKDGTSLTQFEEDGKENKYPDINRSKLVAFEIRKAGIEDKPDKLLFKLFLDPGRRLIYRRRLLDKMKFGKANPEFVSREIIYLVGWQATIGGRNVQDIAYVFEDGHVELSGMWREAPYDVIGKPILAETKFFDEKHLGISAKVVKRNKKQFGFDAVLVKKEKGDLK